MPICQDWTGDNMAGRKTTWDIEDQTAAKHLILRKYLEGWFGVMGHSQPRIVYMDAFAGPGEYSDGTPGSPLIALDVLRNHRVLGTKCEFVMLFNEMSRPRHDHLLECLQRAMRSDPLPINVTIKVENTDFNDLSEKVREALDSTRGRLAPTFAFLDPFGYSGLTMDAINRLFSGSHTDLLVYLDTNSLNRFGTSASVFEQFNALYGTTDFAAAPAAREPKRLQYFIDLYAQQLKSVCGFSYTRTFQMRNNRGQRTYNLVFGTRHTQGLKLMKEAMWKAAPDGSFSFDARTANQPMLPIDLDIPRRVGDLLSAQFDGQTMTVKELEGFLLTDTDFLPAHLRHGLRLLERSEALTVTRSSVPRRANTYPKDCVVTFLPR